MTIFPTGYEDKGFADATDKVWASDEVTNFNITVDEIGDEVFADRTTTNLAEGTNLYYTEGRVSANSTVVGKADKTNVLEKNNTTAYIPTAQYHPATKDYVDTRSLPVASTTTQGIIEIATDAEVATGTDTSRAITPAQLESTRKVAILQGTRNIGDATGTQVIAHGLGFTPKWIEVTAFTDGINQEPLNVNGFSNGSINRCSGTNFNYSLSKPTYAFNEASNVIYFYIDQNSGAWDWLTRATATFDATNITLNWTTTGTSNPGGVIYYTILAHS